MPRFLFFATGTLTRTKDLEIRMRECPHQKRALEDALSSLRYTYLKALVPLLHRRRGLKDQAYEQRKRREALFPRSVEEYHKITDREVQLRVARFLVADSLEQERMMDKFGWAYRGVDPLRSAYRSNVRVCSCQTFDTPGPIRATGRVQGGNRRYAEGYSGIGSKEEKYQNQAPVRHSL